LRPVEIGKGRAQPSLDDLAGRCRHQEPSLYGVVVPDLPGCTSAGATTDEALRNPVGAVRLWAEDALARGEALPAPRDAQAYALTPTSPQRLPKVLRSRSCR
jgi:predicted RNase H-like HicB family nuclease